MRALAAMHAGKKQLGLDDDTWRVMLMRVTGKSSARDMTETERNRVVEELRAKGFKPGFLPASKGGRTRLEGKFVPKLHALWIAGWNLGVVRDRDDKAMIAFVQRQTGLDHVRFLHDPADAARAIEGLKGWLGRAAGVDWSDGNHLPAWLRCDGAKVALAQWRRLTPGDEHSVRASIAGFRRFVMETARPIDQMQPRDWIPVMNTLGERVRRVV